MDHSVQCGALFWKPLPRVQSVSLPTFCPLPVPMRWKDEQTGRPSLVCVCLCSVDFVLNSFPMKGSGTVNKSRWNGPRPRENPVSNQLLESHAPCTRPRRQRDTDQRTRLSSNGHVVGELCSLFVWESVASGASFGYKRRRADTLASDRPYLEKSSSSNE